MNSKFQFKCLQCGGEHFEPGRLHPEGWTQVTFAPDLSSWWRRWFSSGVRMKVLACRNCGLIHAYADIEKVDELTAEGESRCRRCRHILRGLTQPRCPECGEHI